MTQALTPFDRLYGLELTRCGPDVVEGFVPVQERITQVSGLVHGGVYAAIAETLASLGTNRDVGRKGLVALGASNQTSFLRPISRGRIRAVARPVHRGRTTWVWEVDFVDDQGRLCSVSTVTVMVRGAAQAQPRGLAD